MSACPSLRPLFNFKGWVIQEINLNSKSVIVKLRIDKRYVHRCPVCNKPMAENRRLWQKVLDLPMGITKITEIVYESWQGRCSNCKSYFTINPDGIDENAKATTILMHYVCKLCRFLSTDKIFNFIPISTSTARRWDKKILSKYLPEPNLDCLRILLVDEKSIGSHHHYLTVVLNGESGEVLHIAEGKKKESLESFFLKLSPAQIAKIEAVGIDRGGAYKAVLKEYAPNAAIVFDKFHLVANYNQAIDDVRRSEWRNADEDNKDFIKGQRYNLFRNPENLKPEQKVDLEKLLKLNEPLYKTYVLKDAFKQIWTYVYPKCAEKYLDKWIGWAKETALPPLIKFAKGLDRDRKEILSFIRHRITSAKLEAFNATIARIVRKACGYRDLDYLFLKIRQEGLPVLQR
jgi:transposase